MQVILLNIAIGIIGYMLCILLFSFIKGKYQNKRNKNDDGDDEGGLPVAFPPDFDLPPGVCLPDSPHLEKIKEPDEVPA